MSKLKRLELSGRIYFIVAVTAERQPILCDNFDLLDVALNRASDKLEFDTLAHVVLPDHFHILIRPAEAGISTILQVLKLSFSKMLRFRQGRASGNVWQKRFWDHAIRDQRDLNTHFDYIHYNPVKHGLTKDPFEWPYSSYQDFVRREHYSMGWGVNEAIEFEGYFGE